MCICAEQTFAQTSAKEKNFAQAFSIALCVYAKSTIRNDVNKAIGVLLEGGDMWDRLQQKQLENLIKEHRLRKFSLSANNCAYGQVDL